MSLPDPKDIVELIKLLKENPKLTIGILLLSIFAVIMYLRLKWLHEEKLKELEKDITDKTKGIIDGFHTHHSETIQPVINGFQDVKSDIKYVRGKIDTFIKMTK